MSKGVVYKLQIFVEEKHKDVFKTNSAEALGKQTKTNENQGLPPGTQFGIGILLKWAMSKGG